MIDIGTTARITGLGFKNAVANGVVKAYGQTPELKRVPQWRFRDNRFKFSPPEVYYHRMITGDHRERAVWNNAVDQKKKARHLSRVTRRSAAIAALHPSDFDGVREYRRALRNHAVALLDNSI